MKHILVISFSNLKTDSRVRRHVNLLKKTYALTVACFEAEATSEYDLILLEEARLTPVRKSKLATLLALRLFKQAYQTQYPHFSLGNRLTSKPNLIIANDVETLPLAFSIAEKYQCPVVMDAHEYAPRHFEDKLMWRLFFQPLNLYLCKKYIPRVTGFITIGKGLAREYEKHFPVKPVVVTNANNYFELSPSKASDTKIKLVHHGIANASRKLELMIEMMNYLDERFTLDMFLLSPSQGSAKTKNYPTELKALAAKNPRVRILDPIKSELIVPQINAYDMGVFLVPPINFNYENGLPNKLFDFIQARLAIAVGPTPEMAEIVHQYNLGVVSHDFNPKSLADKLNAMTRDDLMKFKTNTARAAQELNAEENAKILVKVIEQSF